MIGVELQVELQAVREKALVVRQNLRAELKATKRAIKEIQDRIGQLDCFIDNKPPPRRKAPLSEALAMYLRREHTLRQIQSRFRKYTPGYLGRALAAKVKAGEVAQTEDGFRIIPKSKRSRSGVEAVH